MKFFLLILFLFIASGQLFSQKKSTISFEQKTYDLRNVSSKIDSIYTITFRFENIGDKPIIIKKVTPSCSCVVSEWTKQPVAPGQKGIVIVRFNPKNINGKFLKSIFIESNAEPKIVLLKLKGYIK